jgi:phosphatidylglycerophosphatase GEP4
MNVSATLNVLRLLWSPQLCIPQVVVSSFDRLPVPLGLPGTDIRAVVLDKDNCFAKAHDDKVWPAYEKKWAQLQHRYPGAQLLIVSNSAGTNDDVGHKQARLLEDRTGVKVLRHSTKKPGCHPEIMEHFYKHTDVEGPHQVAIVGDRLFTDVLMANTMGSQAVWVHDGVERSQSLICKAERWFYTRLTSVELPPVGSVNEKKE